MIINCTYGVIWSFHFLITYHELVLRGMFYIVSWLVCCSMAIEVYCLCFLHWRRIETVKKKRMKVWTSMSLSSCYRFNLLQAHKYALQKNCTSHDAGVWYIPSWFPSSAKSSKLSNFEATPAKGSLTSGKLSPPRIETPAHLPEVDLVYAFIYLFLTFCYMIFLSNALEC